MLLIIIKPTNTNTGAVAAAGIAKKKGAKNSEMRKQTPVIKEVKPLRPPSFTPAALSTYTATVLVPITAPAAVDTEQTPEEIVRTMNINAVAPMFVALAALPDMIRRNSGHICNITSAGGMLANPKMSVYAASKWAATGWSDSVRIELEEMKSDVHVTTVTPYYINTGMFNGVKSPLIPILKPEYVCKRVIRAIERNTRFRGIPFGFHFIRFWQAILPTTIFDFFFGNVVGLYHAMDNFTGRQNPNAAATKAS